MRKIVFSLFVLSLALVSCDSDNGDGLIQDRSAYEVKPNAVVKNTAALDTKSGPINSGFTENIPIGVYAYNSSWLAGSSANFLNNNNATVAGTPSTHPVTLASGPYYFPTDGSVLNFFAFSPQGTEFTAAGVGTSPVVTFPINGQDDVLWASATGNKTAGSPAVQPVFVFAHRLSQLQFMFTSVSPYPATGNKVVSLKILAQPTTVNMTVETGICAFSGTAPMEALSSANQIAGINIVTAGTNANSPIMTAPGTTYSLTVVVQPASGANITYANVPLTLTTVAGSAHMVTLNFSLTAISATATVTDWVNGASGSVSI